MSFKDKKEEVIEIKMTQFGKHLLSKGKFKPSYYAFFDDDVIYDWQYTSDSLEAQNYAETRILEETPVTKTQVNFSSAEDSVHEQVELVRSNKLNLKEALQQDPEKHYAMSAPLGKSSLSSNYSPSWQINIYGKQFESQNLITQGEQPTLAIPQLNVETLTYRTLVKSAGQNVDYGTFRSVGDPGEGGHPDSSAIMSRVSNDGSIIEVLPEHFILDVDEFNTDVLRENYEIEMFVVENEIVNGKNIEKLVPLSFLKGFDNIRDGILLDDSEVESYSEENVDPTYVEHYFEIDVDEEIDKKLLCQLGYRTDFSRRSYVVVECDESGEIRRKDNIYDSTAEPPFGDDC